MFLKHKLLRIYINQKKSILFFRNISADTYFMKYILLFLINFAIFSQNTPPINQNSMQKNKTEDTEDLDKEFYTYYYMNLPKYLQAEEKDKKKLQANILKVMKKEIGKRDRLVTKEELQELKATDIRTKRVFEDSPWLRLIKKEMKYIQFTDYMFIAKYKKYMIFVLYNLDPEKHLITPVQVEYLKAELNEPVEVDN